MKIEYIPSAYLLCCENGHEIEFFEYDGAEALMCMRCGLTPAQIQELTIGGAVPSMLIEVQK